VTEVAITGIGVVSSLGNGVRAFAEALWQGHAGCRPARRVGGPEGVVVAEADAPDVRAIARSGIARRIDRPSLLALAASVQALEDAGLSRDAAAGERGALALGSALGNLAETEMFLDRLRAKGTGNPLVFPNLVLNAPLGYLSIELGITGPSAMVNEQEASGEAAIQWGAQLVARGSADICLAGGADELTGMVLQIFDEAGLLARVEPRPLDARADGFAAGEGAAIVVLEPLARARARGARIYGRIVPDPGFATPASVHGWSHDAAAVASQLRSRLDDVDCVVASASGLPRLDALESAVLATAAPRRPITAPRGAIGTFGSAGALAVAVAALAVAHGVIPPTLGCEMPREHTLDVVRGAARKARVRAALVTGLARGGIVRPVRVEAVW